MLEKRGEGFGLRVGMRVSGCTGYAYTVDYVDEAKEEDHIFISQGINVVVDAKSLLKLEGTTVDYVKQNILNYGFEFINPNVAEACGCGESFSFK
jgi:iron-sulfur cluster assembly protein